MTDTRPTTPRSEVYAAIDSERAYQERRWDEDITHINRGHEIGAWLCFMDDYMTRAKHAIAEGNEAEAMNQIRKVTALGVVTMEQHGAPLRD